MAVPAQAYWCEERRKLKADLMAIMDVVVTLQNQRRASIAGGGTDLIRIERELAAAHRQWQKAQTAYQSHTKQHGC